MMIGYGDFYELKTGKQVKIVGKATYQEKEIPLILFCEILSGGFTSEVYAVEESKLLDLIKR